MKFITCFIALLVLYLVHAQATSYQIHPECRSLTNCISCATNYNCMWCKDSNSCTSTAGGTAACLNSNAALFPSQCSNSAAQEEPSVANDPAAAAVCAPFGTCTECASQPTCVWCYDTNGCIPYANVTEISRACQREATYPSDCQAEDRPDPASVCAPFMNCTDCASQSTCFWCRDSNSCMPYNQNETRSCQSDAIYPNDCSVATPTAANCAPFSSCRDCASQPNCVWCKDTSSCIPYAPNTNSTCVSEAVYAHDCDVSESPVPEPAPSTPEATCALFSSCSACASQAACVWCFDNNGCIPFLNNATSSCTREAIIPNDCAEVQPAQPTLPPHTVAAEALCSTYNGRCEMCTRMSVCVYCPSNHTCIGTSKASTECNMQVAAMSEFCPEAASQHECEARSTCSLCTAEEGCVWCTATNSCNTSTVEAGAAPACPFGTIISASNCPVQAEESEATCAGFGACSSCVSLPSCVWCLSTSKCLSMASPSTYECANNGTNLTAIAVSSLECPASTETGDIHESASYQNVTACHFNFANSCSKCTQTNLGCSWCGTCVSDASSCTSSTRITFENSTACPISSSSALSGGFKEISIVSPTQGQHLRMASDLILSFNATNLIANSTLTAIMVSQGFTSSPKFYVFALGKTPEDIVGERMLSRPIFIPRITGQSSFTSWKITIVSDEATPTYSDDDVEGISEAFYLDSENEDGTVTAMPSFLSTPVTITK